jgi:hypothetical protein
MLPWVRHVGILATVLSTGVISIAPAIAQTSATLPDDGRAPALVRKLSPNVRAQPGVATPIGNVRVTVAPTGETQAQTFSLSGGSTQTTLGFGGARATVIKPAGVGEIVCTIKINYPHDSGHNPGSVNVTGSITCTAPVTFLEIGVGLYLNGYLTASNYASNSGKLYVSTNAAAVCLLPGVYEGGDVGYVIFPPGYVPPASNWGGAEFYSPAEYIVC